MSHEKKSQSDRIQEIGLGAWLDEPLDLDEFYGPAEKKCEIKNIINKWLERLKEIKNMNPKAKWIWMSDWCKERGLSPYIEKNWDSAEQAWERRNEL